MKKIIARPNLNGNTSIDFCDAALKLSRAVTGVEKALTCIRADVMHGRNYQHISNGTDNAVAREKDDAALAEAYLKAQEIYELAKSIMDAALEDA